MPCEHWTTCTCAERWNLSGGQDLLPGTLEQCFSATISVQDKGSRWEIVDEANKDTYLIRKDKAGYGLNVYVSEESRAKRKIYSRRGLQKYPPLLFRIELEYQNGLDHGNVSENLRKEFEGHRASLSQNAAVVVEEENGRWLITDSKKNYRIKKVNNVLEVSHDSTVPPGHVFAMGDNRDQSNDSRAWGPVPIENIKGQAFLKYWSWNSDASWLNKVRFSRIGRVVR